MPGISISGLASGLETDAIIAKLMEVERLPKARLERREGQAKARADALRDISSKLQALSGAASDLRSAGSWADVQAVGSSDPASVTARLLSGTGPGGYQLEATQLARAEQRTFSFTANPAPQSLTINGTAVALGAGASLADAVAKINADPETGVYAVASGGQLVLSSRRTGAANAIAASGAGIAEDPAKLRAGLDAAYSLDGVAATSASNVIADAVPGLELTLKSVTAGPVTVSVGNPETDRGAVEAKLKAFVTAYNSALDAIRRRLTDTPVPKPGSQAEANRGVLFGDSQLTALVTQLRQAVAGSGLAALGISTGAPGAGVSASSDSVIGRLVLDESKLAAALEADPAAVRKTVTGFAEPFTDLLASTIGAGGTMAGRLESIGSESRRLGEQMAALTARLEAREERLRLQFAAMESALQRSKTESQWLSGQLEGLAAG